MPLYIIYHMNYYKCCITALKSYLLEYTIKNETILYDKIKYDNFAMLGIFLSVFKFVINLYIMRQ